MADFDNIEGWREDLREFEGKFPNRISIDGDEPIPILSSEIPVKLAELMLEDDELKDSIDAIYAYECFSEENPDLQPGHPKFQEQPTSAYKTVADFANWYTTKVHEPCWFLSWHGCALGLAMGVVSGDFESPRSAEAKKFINDNYDYSFE